MRILLDAANQQNSLETARHERTATRSDKVNRGTFRPLHTGGMNSPYEKKKQKEIRRSNKEIRALFNEPFDYNELSYIMWGMGYSVDEPRFIPELPKRPFNRKKLNGMMSPNEARIIEKQLKKGYPFPRSARVFTRSP